MPVSRPTSDTPTYAAFAAVRTGVRAGRHRMLGQVAMTERITGFDVTM